SARQLAEALAEIGAQLSIGGGGGGGRGGAGGGGGTSTISLNGLSGYFDQSLALLTHLLLHPSFPADALEKWKSSQRSALEQARTQPAALSSEMLMKVLYPNDARHFTRVTAESLDKITRERLLEFYKTYYVPSGDWAGIVGEVSPRDAVAKLEK